MQDCDVQEINEPRRGGEQGGTEHPTNPIMEFFWFLSCLDMGNPKVHEKNLQFKNNYCDLRTTTYRHVQRFRGGLVFKADRCITQLYARE